MCIFYTKNERFFDLYYYGLLELARGDLFQDTEEEEEEALLHIRTSAYYPSHPQMIPTIFLRSLPV